MYSCLPIRYENFLTSGTGLLIAVFREQLLRKPGFGRGQKALQVRDLRDSFSPPTPAEALQLL